MQLTNANVQNIIDTVTNNANNITAQQVIDALQNVPATTFATLTQASRVKAHAGCNDNVFKVTVQNVTLCNSSANLYTNAVTREVQATEQAESFTALKSNYVQLNNSYSVVALKSNTNKHYLQAIVNRCLQVVYYCATTKQLLTKQQVAEQCFKADSKGYDNFLNAQTETTVQHANITHNVTVRTFALQNIYTINVAKQTLKAA